MHWTVSYTAIGHPMAYRITKKRWGEDYKIILQTQILFFFFSIFISHIWGTCEKKCNTQIAYMSKMKRFIYLVVSQELRKSHS